MRILIADDEANIVTALEFLLRGEGYEVDVARTGEEALARLRDWRPDLVVLDVMMPMRSGYEICMQIRACPELAAIRVVMLSAKGAQADVQKGFACGADLYITKPFSNRDVVERIGQLLAR
jgi:DNA-binding response OmpR family regulator